MKTLSAAVLAGLGVAGTAQAVHLNPDGHGQVLLYPYYTVQNGFDTYVHVVNTSSTEVKAVKVRFLEGKNSREVLDFNLYLSPRDEWTGAITRTEAGAGVTSNDTSCIAPRQLPALGSAPEEFRDTVYVADGDSVQGRERTREGYLEIIEMGVVANPVLAAAATHPQSGPEPVPVPADCGAIRTAAADGGILNNRGGDATVLPPSGGLYGFASLINVQIGENPGVKMSIDAVALDNFYFDTLNPINDLHFPPGDVRPSLDFVNTPADVLDGNQIVTSDNDVTNGRRDIDTVSMVIMHDTIMNDYEVDQARLSKTDWVVTFPTKRFYVNQPDTTPLALIAPFATVWNPDNSSSCDPINVVYWDREEQLEQFQDDFSPRPPVSGTNLCNEVNTLSVKPNGAPSEYITLFGAEFTSAQFELAPNYQGGWMKIGFTGANAHFTGVDPVDPSVQNYEFYGLPVIGFSGIDNVNGTITNEAGVNVLANYMSATTHKGTRDIVPVELPE